MKKEGESPGVLIFGASRHIGKYLFQRLGPGASVATYCHRPLAGAEHFDVLKKNVEPLLDSHPSIKKAVLLIGETDPNKCVADRARSDAVNVQGLRQVIDALIDRDFFVVFMSSQFIFDGRRGCYTEKDLPSPILLYGEQKVLIEDYLRNRTTRHCILRLSKAVGDLPGDGTLFSDWLRQVLGGQRLIRCATDQIQSPIYIPDAVEALVRVLDGNFSGTYNLCGEEVWSRMQLLELLVDTLRKSRDVSIDLIPCGINDFDLPEKRPLNLSMKPDRLIAATGLSLISMKEVCRRAVENELSVGRGGGERG